MTNSTANNHVPHGDVTISVVITNYNYEAFLGAAIQSVLDQSYPHVQCIVVDDGSTDGSLAIARQFPGVEVIAKPNGGQVSAAKRALELVRGELTLFLDSDDSLYPDACAKVMEVYRPGVILYQFGLDMVNPQGGVVGSYPDAPLIDSGQGAYALAHGFFPSSPTSGNCLDTAHVRRMLDESGGDERYFVDGYLIYSAPFFGEVVTSTQKLGRYLVHGQNVSLSAGVNARSAEKSVRNALWQRTGISNALHLTGRPGREAAAYLTAYQLRYILILRRCYGVRDIVPEWSDTQVAWEAARKFLRYPGISAGQKMRNLVLLLLTLAGVTGPARRLVPPVPAL